MTENAQAQWDGDVLRRKPIADFLHRLVVHKYNVSENVPQSGAICFALDGAWGSGKSFFVSKWVKDIEACQHPVVFFDAWKNDLSEEPLTSFIAALQDGLKQWTKEVPVSQTVKTQTRNISKNVLRKAGRAVIPVSALIAKGFLKKVSGTELQEWIDALRDKDDTHDDVETVQRESSGGSQVKNEVIDEFFRISIEEHAKRTKAIDDLKIATGELLRYLDENVKATLPMFVFIDELDRCRPNYAIELLEGVKHLFDVRGLCFCISTNLEQLGESIRGVYGAGFDAPKYLKRFFSFEYVLPDPPDQAFAELLIPNSLLMTHDKIVPGLSDSATRQDPSVASIAAAFHFVAGAFNLDLRSQRQVFEVADAASAGVDPAKPVHLIYLFALAALRHLDRRAFEKLETAGIDGELKTRLSELINPNWTHSYQVTVSVQGAYRGERKTKQIGLEQLLGTYVQMANKDLNAIYEDVSRRNSDAYPYAIERAIADERPSTYYPHQPYPPSIRSYPVLIRTAGQLSWSPE